MAAGAEPTPGRAEDGGQGRWAALRVVLPPWVLARVATLVALAAAHAVFARFGTGLVPNGAKHLNMGLMAWDADWYRRIATYGYAGVPQEGLRFFPLLPLIGRWLAPLFGGSVSAALLTVANCSALAYGVLLYRLTERETADRALAARAVRLALLVPIAFVLVMGYAEALEAVLVVGGFLALRRRRWALAAALGVATGLLRPLGLLMAAPAAAEVFLALRAGGLRSWRERLAALAAVAGPPAGVGAYLAWVGYRFGDPLLPVTIQARSDLHGAPGNPLVVLARATGDLVTLGNPLEGLHVLWVAFALVLLVVCWRRLPLPYAAFAAATLAATMTGQYLSSFERYAFSAFPLLIAWATLLRTRRAERVNLALCAAGMVLYGTLAFLGTGVP